MTKSKPKAPDLSGSAFLDLVARYERESLDQLRQIDLLHLKVQQYRELAEDADAKASMLQAAIDRHMAHCGRDEGAVQRLKAELQEANARRKEQAIVIARREERIESLLAIQPRLSRMLAIGSFLSSKIGRAAR